MVTQSAPKVQTFLVESQSIFRDGLQSLLELQPDIELVGTASDAERALQDLESANVDVVIINTDLPGMDGIEATRSLKKEHPELKIIVLNSYSDEYIEDALEAGATGYLLKSCTRHQLIHAIRETAQGMTFIDPSLTNGLMNELIDLRKSTRSSLLTHRQIQVLTLVANGRRYQEIARKLFVSRSTVNREIRNIIDQLKATDIAQAIYEAHKKNQI